MSADDQHPEHRRAMALHGVRFAVALLTAQPDQRVGWQSVLQAAVDHSGHDPELSSVADDVFRLATVLADGEGLERFALSRWGVATTPSAAAFLTGALEGLRTVRAVSSARAMQRL